MTASNVPIYLHYKLMLRSPAIVSTFAGDPNSVATEPFIPGSAIRGAMATRLLSDGIKGEDKEFHALILSGAVRYLHAYPEAGGARALPAPVSWRVEKDDSHSAYDLTEFSGTVSKGDDFRKRWPQEALASVSAPFVALSPSRERILPRLNARLHQQRDRVKGRSWKDSNEQSHGAIFAYEYLEADQLFRGAIQVMQREAARADRIKALFAQPVFIGRSRRAGYGGEAAIEFTHDRPQEYDNVSDLPSSGVRAGNRFRAMLTSAYIGRHPATGQIDPAALEQELCNLLDGAATVERQRRAFALVGGFNQKWRLELPQVLAVAAGSTLVLKAEQPIPIASLRGIEHTGLGERRIEGFGRLVFLKHDESRQTFTLKNQENRKQRKPEVTKPAGAASPPDEPQLRFVETRIVLAAARAELDRVATLDNKVDGKIPTTSLVGRLRTLFRNVIDEKTAKIALSKLATWCSDDDSNPNALRLPARKKLDDCRIFNSTLRQWLLKLAQPGGDETQWATLIRASGNTTLLTGLATRHYLTGKEAAQAILQANASELSIYFIDAVLAALARRNRGRSR